VLNVALWNPTKEGDHSDPLENTAAFVGLMARLRRARLRTSLSRYSVVSSRKACENAEGDEPDCREHQTDRKLPEDHREDPGYEDDPADP
jgi:hypothetical protein